MLPCLSPERFLFLLAKFTSAFSSFIWLFSNLFFFFFKCFKHWCFLEAFWTSSHPSPPLCCHGNRCLFPPVCACLHPLVCCVCFCLILQFGACCKIGIPRMFGESFNILIWSRFYSNLRNSFLATIGTCMTVSYLKIRKRAFKLHSKFYIYWFF